MISTEKKIGLPTVRQARMTISRVSPSIRCPGPKWAVSWCVAFSTITIAWSTRMPIEMAMPESDMMFEGTLELAHEDERHEHRQRQRHADHHGAAEVHEDQQDGDRGDDHLVAAASRVTVSMAPWMSRVRS